MSFVLFNLVKLINSPAVQFLEAVFRGKETRESIGRHTSTVFRNLNDLPLNGMTLVLPEGKAEELNLVVFYIASAAHIPSSRMPGNHIHGNGLPATFVPGRRNVCEGCWAVDES